MLSQILQGAAIFSFITSLLDTNSNLTDFTRCFVFGSWPSPMAWLLKVSIFIIRSVYEKKKEKLAKKHCVVTTLLFLLPTALNFIPVRPRALVARALHKPPIWYAQIQNLRPWTCLLEAHAVGTFQVEPQGVRNYKGCRTLRGNNKSMRKLYAQTPSPQKIRVLPMQRVSLRQANLPDLQIWRTSRIVAASGVCSRRCCDGNGDWGAIRGRTVHLKSIKALVLVPNGNIVGVLCFVKWNPICYLCRTNHMHVRNILHQLRRRTGRIIWSIWIIS